MAETVDIAGATRRAWRLPTVTRGTDDDWDALAHELAGSAWRWIDDEGCLVSVAEAVLLNGMAVESDIPPEPFQLHRLVPLDGMAVTWDDEVGKLKRYTGTIIGGDPAREAAHVRGDDHDDRIVAIHKLRPA